ncbi:protein kinase domain-containing protein [Streptomyces sp. NBC_01803]|uniref:protein kinase domain-containing protein n=1 Tax=Streptomyces sp. NBC_01803 TaxID=2975946 RepID=UPI002DD97FC5|nr:protein kinase [Streptomyces sp. NBC_01803]WSA46485.1 protein kinase [Streptomyces sp. NBC_01803]
MKPLGSTDPRELGGYRLLGRLGAGGMGQVYLGRTPDGRTVAVKLIHPHLAHEPEFRRRFRLEVAAAQRVSGEWTMPVLDSDTEADMPWLATGFVPGPSLTRVVDELHGPLPEFSVWRLAEGLARALAVIHGAGVTHRDLKPSNVLITLDGPRVIDFGIARAADGGVATRTGVAVGSPGYMAPEQIRGERLTEASDIFGLGAVLAYALTGNGPFGTSESAAHTLMHRVLAEAPELGGLAGPMRDLIERCLDKDAAGRPTPGEIIEEAARHQDPDGAEGVWLPPALTAELGKEAARLLAVGGPAAAPGGPSPQQGSHAEMSIPHNMPTMTSSPGFAPPHQPTPPPQATPAPGHLPAPYATPAPAPAPAPGYNAPAPYATPTPAPGYNTPPPHVTAPWPQPGAMYPQPVVAYPPVAYPVAAAYVPYSPYGYDALGRPLSNKSKVVAGLLQIFLGVFGVGRFYTGHVGIGLIQLFTCGGWGLWALIDGIVFLVSDSRTDGMGRILKS